MSLAPLPDDSGAWSDSMDYMSKSALVKRLGISPRTLENWISARGFPRPLHVHGSRLAFFKLSAVQAWFEAELEGQA